MQITGLFTKHLTPHTSHLTPHTVKKTPPWDFNPAGGLGLKCVNDAHLVYVYGYLLDTIVFVPSKVIFLTGLTHFYVKYAVQVVNLITFRNHIPHQFNVYVV
jgi:hypothetical protein